MIGLTFSHYRITEKLGEGGMGEVYLAEDTTLRRKVALKFLPQHLHQDELAHKRFLREAESAAALDHPYICHINEVSRTDEGQDFIVMEYVQGQTLKDKFEEGPLSFEETLKISKEIADALALAHKRGIVHRDLKPANIMLTPQGHAKVMDFGLAKKVVTDDGTEQDLTSGLTREGSTLGTPAYMSPEQVRAEQVDHRTDIFSFGIIFYEMLTGVHPFRRPRPVETMGAILHEEPEPLAEHIPGSTELLQETVNQLLAKNPEERIQTIEELQNRLSQLSSPELQVRVFLHSRLGRRLALALTVVIAVLLLGWWALREVPAEVDGPTISSIAVLPLGNLSGDPEEDYFVDGMTDALITDLSKIGALKVISRRSAMRYKGTDKPLSQIAQELNVEAVIDGSVFREADQVQIMVQLIDAATGQNLWANRYEHKLTSILALHGEVAQDVARQIHVTLTPGEETSLTRTRQVNPEAYEAYLKGRFYQYKLTAADLETSLQYFELALDRDRDYAPAYAGIAITWAGLQQMSFVWPSEGGPKAREAALKAVELDDTLAETHYALAAVRCWTDWDWEGAEESFRRAIELNPNYGDAHSSYSHLLTIMKRSEEAMARIGRALELDPFSPKYQGFYCMDLNYVDRHDEAIEVARNILRTVPNHPLARGALWMAYYAKGMPEELLAEIKATYESFGDQEAREALELGEAEAGYRGAMIRLAEMLVARSLSRPVGFCDIAQIYAYAGENDRVLEWLERAFEERDPNLPYIGVWSDFDNVRHEPRFQDLLRRMNFPEDVIARILNDTE